MSSFKSAVSAGYRSLFQGADAIHHEHAPPRVISPSRKPILSLILCSPVDDALLEVAGAVKHGVFSDPHRPVFDALPSVKLLRQ